MFEVDEIAWREGPNHTHASLLGGLVDIEIDAYTPHPVKGLAYQIRLKGLRVEKVATKAWLPDLRAAKEVAVARLNAMVQTGLREEETTMDRPGQTNAQARREMALSLVGKTTEVIALGSIDPPRDLPSGIHLPLPEYGIALVIRDPAPREEVQPLSSLETHREKPLTLTVVGSGPLLLMARGIAIDVTPRALLKQTLAGRTTPERVEEAYTAKFAMFPHGEEFPLDWDKPIPPDLDCLVLAPTGMEKIGPNVQVFAEQLRKLALHGLSRKGN